MVQDHNSGAWKTGVIRYLGGRSGEAFATVHTYIKKNTSEHNISRTVKDRSSTWAENKQTSQRRRHRSVIRNRRFRDYDSTTLSPLMAEWVLVPEAADVLPGSLHYYPVELRAIRLVSVSKRLDGAGQGHTCRTRTDFLPLERGYSPTLSRNRPPQPRLKRPLSVLFLREPHCLGGVPAWVRQTRSRWEPFFSLMVSEPSWTLLSLCTPDSPSATPSDPSNPLLTSLTFISMFKEDSSLASRYSTRFEGVGPGTYTVFVMDGLPCLMFNGVRASCIADLRSLKRLVTAFVTGSSFSSVLVSRLDGFMNIRIFHWSSHNAPLIAFTPISSRTISSWWFQNQRKVFDARGLKRSRRSIRIHLHPIT